MTSMAIWPLLLAGPACNGDKGDSAGEGDTDTDADSDTDTDTDTDTDCSGKPAGTAEKQIVGDFTVVPGKSYSGTEAVQYTDSNELEKKGKTPFCRITYTLTSTAVRTDCAEGKDDYAFDCTDLWAFDVVTSGASIDPDYPDCAGILCGADVATLNGQTRGYGYGVVVGHAWMFGEYTGKAWQPRAYPDGKDPMVASGYEFVRPEDSTVDYYE